MTLESFKGGTAVVVGSTGGIGAAVLEAIEASGRFDRVIGLARRTEPALDLLDEASIEAAAEHVKAEAKETGGLRLVFDATGALSKEGLAPEKALSRIDAEATARAFAINATGPALLLKHFARLMPREGRSVFATLSARVGSIADNGLGGWYSYRASKAAANQIVKCAAIELKRTKPEAVLISLHPGTVDTGLSTGFAKAGLTVQAPADSAAAMLAVLDATTVEESGGFKDHKGETIPF